jgi:DNA-binding NarL/FixJ family response regulator
MQPRVFIASRHSTERSALRLLLPELDSQIVGEAGDWRAVLVSAAYAKPDVVVLDWNVMSAAKVTAVSPLRQVCPPALLIVLMSRLDLRQQEALGAGADVVVNKDDDANCVVENLRCAISLRSAPN